MWACRASLLVLAYVQPAWSLEEAASCVENQHADVNSARVLLQVQKHRAKNESEISIAPGQQLTESETTEDVNKARVANEDEDEEETTNFDVTPEDNKALMGKAVEKADEEESLAKEEANASEGDSLEKDLHNKRDSSHGKDPADDEEWVDAVNTPSNATVEEKSVKKQSEDEIEIEDNLRKAQGEIDNLKQQLAAVKEAEKDGKEAQGSNEQEDSEKEELAEEDSQKKSDSSQEVEKDGKEAQGSNEQEDSEKEELAVEELAEEDSQQKSNSSQDMSHLKHLFAKSPSAPSSNDTSHLAGIRLEMARRALMIMHEREGPAEESKESIMARANRSSPKEGLEANQPEDVTRPQVLSGSTAGLNEQGYAGVSACCCPLEMSIYTERIITHFGFKVCNQGSLEGLVAWYYCQNQSRTFQELADEALDAADGECAWIGTESACPTMSANCPSFPDTSGHRRRVCAKRHEDATVDDTVKEAAVSYVVQSDVHCGYYTDCGGTNNYDPSIPDKKTKTPNADCVPLCDGSPQCAGFTYNHDHDVCYFRRNVTCGVFSAEQNDCWAKP